MQGRRLTKDTAAAAAAAAAVAAAAERGEWRVKSGVSGDVRLWMREKGEVEVEVEVEKGEKIGEVRSEKWSGELRKGRMKGE
jgi:uncharacterized protein (DUF169 family)